MLPLTHYGIVSYVGNMVLKWNIIQDMTVPEQVADCIFKKGWLDDGPLIIDSDFINDYQFIGFMEGLEAVGVPFAAEFLKTVLEITKMGKLIRIFSED